MGLAALRILESAKVEKQDLRRGKSDQHLYHSFQAEQWIENDSVEVLWVGGSLW